MEQLLLDLQYRLEAVGDRDESLYDSYVRERMGLAVFYGFIKPKAGYVLPDEYGLFGGDDRAVRDALRVYTDSATILAPALGLTTFHQRLAAFQNHDVRTAGQKNDFDDFFGWSDPELFDPDGSFIRRT